MITRRADRRSLIHRAGSANSGPPPERPARPAPPSPPKWRNWLLLAGVLVTLALFLLPLPMPGHSVGKLDYSQLKSDIAAGQISSIDIGPDGNISGKLTDGTSFSSTYPVGVQDPQLFQLLDS